MSQTFAYKVWDKLGNPHTGQIESDSRDSVVARLRQNGYIIAKVEAQVSSPSVGETFARWSTVSVKDLAVFCRQFATMVGAGLPLLKCLSILIEQSSKVKLREALEDIRREVESGSAISAAFAKHDLFPTIMIAMVRAGETGGILDEVLARLADHFENEFDLQQKIKTATRYPIFVFGLAMIVVFLMMVFVLPNFTKMLTTMGVELPLPTKILLACSGFLKENVLIVVIAFAIAIYLVIRFANSLEGRAKVDRFLFKVPIIKGIVSKIATARLCRTLGTLINSGVPIIQALEVSQATADNSVIMEGLARARDSIREGEGLAGPLEATGVFSPMVTQMIAVGEETGSLDTMLKKVADFYEKEVKYVVENLSTLIEPILIVFLGAVVGGMIVSILLPMLKIYEAIGNM
ncbi:MAG TPA: type II secretion system F family protein [Desulfobacteria bacterium]|nr:type II secretion system F family protein [Desulfobacteria bacterium]